MRPTTSASNLHRRALCPGSERLEEGLPDSDSADAAEGTLLHGFDADPSLSRATLKPEQRDLLAISGKLSEFVFAETAKQYGFGPEEPFVEEREKTMWLHRGIKSILSGTCDERRFYPGPRVLIVIDKKYGFREVTPAAANKQVRAYAVMAAETQPCAAAVVALTQPRLPYERRVTMAAYTPEDLKAARAELYAILDAAKAPDAPLNPGAEQCLYCKAKLICPAYRGQLAPLEKEPLPLVAGCDDATLDWLGWVIERAEGIAEPVRAEIRARKAADPARLASYTLGREGSMRTIADPERAHALLVGTGTMSDEEFRACAKPAIGKIEETLRNRTGITAKEAKEKVNTLLAGVIENKPRAASLERVSAPAPLALTNL